MEKTYHVYIHTNKINNKKYIGITCQNPEKRWDSGYGYKQQSLFWNAICKYGWDNFDHYVFPETYSEEEAKQKEIELIVQYHTCVLDEHCMGYNITIGGEGGQKYHTDEERHSAYVNSYKKSNKKKYKLIKADKEQYNNLLEYNRLNKQNKLKDPKKHEKLKAYNRNDMKKRRNDPIYAEKQREAHRATSKKITAIRKKLIYMITVTKNIFTIDEIDYITAKTKNGYKYQSLKKLQEIYDRIFKLYEINHK